MQKLRVPIAVATVAILTVAVIYYVDFDHAEGLYRRLVQKNPAAADSNVDSGTVDPNASVTLHHYTRAKRPFAKCAQPGTRAKSFLMVFMSRSGSTAITQTLATHPEIVNKFEYLQSLIGPDYSSEKALNMTRSFFAETVAAGKIPGFKVRSLHIQSNPEAWAALAREFDTRIIWQYRKNLFKTALGVYARLVFNDSTATGGIRLSDYNAVEDRCDMGVGCSFPINNMKTFHGILTSRIRQDINIMKGVRTLDGGRDCMFELPYEDYLYHKEDTINDLFKFLGLTTDTMETGRVKATADSLCSVVENFDELCSNFYGCPIWQPFLDDFENDCRCTSFKQGTDQYCSMYSERELTAVNQGTY